MYRYTTYVYLHITYIMVRRFINLINMVMSVHTTPRPKQRPLINALTWEQVECNFQMSEVHRKFQFYVDVIKSL